MSLISLLHNPNPNPTVFLQLCDLLTDASNSSCNGRHPSKERGRSTSIQVTNLYCLLTHHDIKTQPSVSLAYPTLCYQIFTEPSRSAVSLALTLTFPTPICFACLALLYLVVLVHIDVKTLTTRIYKYIVVMSLCRFGANPSIHDVQKLLPLHHAIINRDIEMVDTLLQHTSALTVRSLPWKRVSV